MGEGIKLSFQRGKLNEEYFGKVIKTHLTFAPYAYTVGTKTKAWDDQKFKRAIKGFVGEDYLSVYDLNGNLISFGLAGPGNSHISINIEIANGILANENTVIESMIFHDGFVSAFLYDKDYAQVQSEKYENNIINRHLSQGALDSIKNTPFSMGVFDTKEYKIQFNPGRWQLIKGTWLMAAYKMWFGTPFFDLVSKERILSFDNALEIKELAKSIIYVHLFANIHESHTSENMSLQWKWREWIDFKSLEEKY